MAATSGKGQGKDKKIRDALILAVSRVEEGDPYGRRKLNMIAEAVVRKAMDGDIAAFKEIADRIDGRAAQQIMHEGGDEPVKIIAMWGKPEASS